MNVRMRFIVIPISQRTERLVVSKVRTQCRDLRELTKFDRKEITTSENFPFKNLFSVMRLQGTSQSPPPPSEVVRTTLVGRDRFIQCSIATT